MDKRKWLWKRKPSVRSPGETDSSGSISSHSERYSDEQDEVKGSPNHSTESVEVSSKVLVSDDEVTEGVKHLTAKLSAALVNVSIKEDLAKQHAKVAEEAVAGWERAENEVTILKQQLEAAVQQNLALEVRVSHLDCALKECVRQLRQAKDEQEQKICDAVTEKNSELETMKAKLEKQLLQLDATIPQNPASVDPDVVQKMDFLEKENSILKYELVARNEELKLRTIERDLSTQAAETASKQQLESIKTVARLEAECKRLRMNIRKLQSDDELERSCSDSWASALIAELDQFTNVKGLSKESLGSSAKIDMMEDFLEMERLAALPEPEKVESETTTACKRCSLEEKSKKVELETMTSRLAELEERLGKIEEDKTQLEGYLVESHNSLMASRGQLKEAEIRVEDLEKDFHVVNEGKELLEFQLIGMEVEARTLKANVDSLMMVVEKEKTLSSEMAAKCEELEKELVRKSQEIELLQTGNGNSEVKIKQEDLVVAADKLAECQQTIASLGMQLKSLATLEDFLIDTSNLPGFCGNKHLVPVSSAGNSNNVLNLSPANGNQGESPSSSSSSSSTKNRNGFSRLFSRSKTGIQLESHQG